MPMVFPSVPLATGLDYYPVCAKAKLHKAAHGHESLHWGYLLFSGPFYRLWFHGSMKFEHQLSQAVN